MRRLVQPTIAGPVRLVQPTIAGPVRLELPPGRHASQLLMGDAVHISHDPPLMPKKITVIVP